jgi:hypothetical protein
MEYEVLIKLKSGQVLREPVPTIKDGHKIVKALGTKTIDYWSVQPKPIGGKSNE